MSFKNVQWLSIDEISDLWSPELSIPKSTILRELQIALYKLEIEYPYSDHLNVDINSIELPTPDTLINRSFIERFHEKQIWKLPDFWFKELSLGPSYPGRPSVMHAIVQELQDIAANGKLEKTLAGQSRHLQIWAEENAQGVQPPKAKAIANGIRTVYNTLKNNQK